MQCVRSIVLLLCLCLIGSCVRGQSEGTEIETGEVVSIDVNGKQYHHLRLELTRNSVVALDELSRKEFERRGGQFELRVKKKAFPVSAPNCGGDIILRMPWTVPDKPNTERAIEEKFEVYQKILALKSSGGDQSVPITVQLNPYVESLDDGLALTHCNAFFRHDDNRYISELGELRN